MARYGLTEEGEKGLDALEAIMPAGIQQPVAAITPAPTTAPAPDSIRKGPR